MHHFWTRTVSFTAAADEYTLTFKNGKNKQILLVIPKKDFFSGNDDVDQQQAEMLAGAIQWVLNSTSGH